VNQETATSAGVSEALADGKLLLTVEEAAQRLGIGRTVMYRLVSSGMVESVTLGRLRRVPRECLSDYVSALRGSHARDDQV
jgi:excisionase family DNA binding protein